MEYEFWFCPDAIIRCVSGNKKKYVLDWPIVSNIWPVKIGTNFSKQEILALKDIGFQLQQTVSDRDHSYGKTRGS